MVFHESLNRERKFSFTIPLVFIAILGGTTGVVEVATLYSSEASYSSNPQTMVAALGPALPSEAPQKAATPKGEDKDKCEAGHQYEVTVDSKGKAETKDVGTKVDCKARDAKGKLVNQSNAMCSRGKDGNGFGELKYKLASGTSKDTFCYPGEDPKTSALAVAARDLGASSERTDLLKSLKENDPEELKRVNDALAYLRDEKQKEIAECASGSLCVGPLNHQLGLQREASNTESAIDAIKKLGADDTAVPNPDGNVVDPAKQFSQDDVAKLRAEQAQISAALAKDPNDERLLYRQEEIARALASQNTFEKPDLAKDAGIDDIGKPEPKPQTWGEWFKEKIFGKTPEPKTEVEAPKPAEPKPVEKEYVGPEFNEAFGSDPNAPKPDPEPKPKNGAPDPNKPYYIERVDENGKNLWCDSGGNCKDAQKFTPQPSQGGPPINKAPSGPSAPAAPPSGGGGGGDIGKALGSMLEGLMKALGAPPPPPAAPAQACSTDQNVYAQQQAQYQQQLQQYNYQLQQAQYQQQMNQYYAERNGGIAPPTQPLPAQPTPCTPSTGNQCQSQPQQPAPSACAAGAWRATYNGACITGWQCISTEGPKASLSCEPQTADVGQTLAITYGCSSGIASSSSFKVTTQPGGSATTTVANPPAGTNTATYTLACTDNGKTTGAQCSVQVSRVNIILVANPKTVPAGDTSLLSWLTTGMQSCIISSPDQADFTARNSSNTSVVGAATTSAITTATSTVLFQLDCKTTSGADKQATTSVSIAS